jgi:hypothetical protein
MSGVLPRQRGWARLGTVHALWTRHLRGRRARRRVRQLRTRDLPGQHRPVGVQRLPLRDGQRCRRRRQHQRVRAVSHGYVHPWGQSTARVLRLRAGLLCRTRAGRGAMRAGALGKGLFCCCWSHAGGAPRYLVLNQCLLLKNINDETAIMLMKCLALVLHPGPRHRRPGRVFGFDMCAGNARPNARLNTLSSVSAQQISALRGEGHVPALPRRRRVRGRRRELQVPRGPRRRRAQR